MKNNPFAGLRGQLGLSESETPNASDSGQIDTPAATPPPHASSPHISGTRVARAVVRMERAGRRGKEATVVEKLGLPKAELEIWLKALKTTLGCGGSVEGPNLMLQGDQRARLPQVLTQRGVRKVIVG